VLEHPERVVEMLLPHKRIHRCYGSQLTCERAVHRARRTTRIGSAKHVRGYSMLGFLRSFEPVRHHLNRLSRPRGRGWRRDLDRRSFRRRRLRAVSFV
jgi:hypothetical protein